MNLIIMEIGKLLLATNLLPVKNELIKNKLRNS